MKFPVSVVLVVAIAPLAAFAQDVDPYMQAAIDSGVCGDEPVVSAVFVPETNTVEATCGPDLTGSVPLAGALGPVLAGGFAVLLAASGSPSSTSDTN